MVDENFIPLHFRRRRSIFIARYWNSEEAVRVEDYWFKVINVSQKVGDASLDVITKLALGFPKSSALAKLFVGGENDGMEDEGSKYGTEETALGKSFFLFEVFPDSIRLEVAEWSRV